MDRFTSVFSQILQLFSRLDFEKAVNETKAERHARERLQVLHRRGVDVRKWGTFQSLSP